MVIANAAAGFVQEARAERALDVLAAMLTVDAQHARELVEREPMPAWLQDAIRAAYADLAGAETDAPVAVRSSATRRTRRRRPSPG